MTNIAKAWSTEQTEAVISAYEAAGQDNGQLATIAKEVGKTVQSVRSKLVSEGVYQKAEARKVGGASTVRKANLVRQISDTLSVENLESLEKASKADLEALLTALVQG